MRSGRNYINALSNDLVIACGIDKGTISKISLSLVNTAKKQVIIVGAIEERQDYGKIYHFIIGKKHFYIFL